MLFNKKFDLVISLGADCTASAYLRRLCLQDYSYPFDWLKNADFNNRLEMLLNDFKDFFVKENLKPLKKQKNADSKCDYYFDTKYDFYFYHDFSSNIDFDAQYDVIKEKYDRRIKRLYEKINSSQNVLFVWWSRNGNLNTQTIEEYYDKLTKKFEGTSIYMLFVENSPREEEIRLKDNHILISRFDNTSYQSNPKWTDTMGNEENNLKIFRQIKYKHHLGWYFKYLLYKILKIFVELTPNSELRRKRREEIKLKFFRIKL